MSTPPHITIDGVHAAYGRIEVLHGVDLDIPGGSIFALLGPNGGGKSTLLKVMNGRLPSTAGTISMEGVEAAPWTPEALARQGVVALPEGRGVFPNLTVRDNLRMWTYRGDIDQAEVEKRTYAQFPRAAGAAQAVGRHALGGRAADAGHLPRPGRRHQGAAAR